MKRLFNSALAGKRVPDVFNHLHPGKCSCVALGLCSRLDSTDYFGFGILRRSTAYFHIGVHVIVPSATMQSWIPAGVYARRGTVMTVCFYSYA